MSTIFVSSTFRDMHYERDALQEKVLPVLNEQAVRYGKNLSFCDLRWGINTADLDSEVGSQKVLDVCLEEIDRCNPPMVVILGERYGWIPSEGLVENVAARKKLQLDHLRKSVTALEIEYGVFSRIHTNQKLLFYFREIKNQVPEIFEVENEECKQLIEELKNRIQNIPNAIIRTYSVECDGEKIVQGIDEFVQMVQDDLLDILMPEWEAYNTRSPFEKECDTHWSFINEKAGLFSARKALADKYLLDLENKNSLIIKGMPGVGKSTLFSYLAVQLQKRDYYVLPFISGLTGLASTASGILKNIIYAMEELLEIDHYTEDIDLKQRYRDLCIELKIKKKKVVVMVDAVDQLFPDNLRDNLIFMPEELSESVRFVMTCIKDFSLEGRSFVEIPLVDDEEIVSIIDTLTKSNNKELDKKVVQAILQKKAANTPLYINFLMYRLTLMNKRDFDVIERYGSGMEDISRYQIELVQECPDFLDDMSVRLMQIISERINEKMISKVLAYMAFSQHGLRMEDFKMLLKEDFVPLDFSHFVIYIKDCFILREDGRYDFSHKSIRNGLRQFYKDQEKRLHENMFAYLQQLDPEDTLRSAEIMYHCILADRKRDFINYVVDNKQNKNLIAHAANNLYEICRQDQGLWIHGVLDTHSLYTQEFIDFLNSDFLNVFGSGDADDHMKEEISKKLYLRAEQMCENDDSEGAMQILYRCIRKYGNVWYSKGRNKGYKAAYEYYTKCMNIAEHLVEINPSAYNRRLLALSCEDVADVYPSAVGVADEKQLYNTGVHDEVYDLYDKALCMYKELLEEKDSIDHYNLLCNVYIKIAKYLIYRSNIIDSVELDKEVLKDIAYENFACALSVAKQSLEKEASISILSKMAYLYKEMCTAYMDNNDDQRRKKAVEYARERVSVLSRVLSRQHTYLNQGNLANAYERLALALLNMREMAYQQEIIELYEKALTIRKIIAEEVDAVYIRWEYATCLHNMGKALIRTKQAGDARKAINYCQQSVDLYEKICLEDESYTEDYARALNGLGDAKMQLCDCSPYMPDPLYDSIQSQIEAHYIQAETLFEKAGITEECYASAEFLEVLSKMEPQYPDMIGIEVYREFEECALRRYKKHLDNRRLKEQNLADRTKWYISAIHFQYWMDNAQERKKLHQKWIENERNKGTL